MRNILFLIIPIYFIYVNCISKKMCNVKCELMFPDITKTKLDGFVANKLCVCSKRLGIFKKENVQDFHKFCIDRYNINTYSVDYSGFSFSCKRELKCNNSLCERFCKDENPYEEHTSYCDKKYECKCKVKTQSCIVSQNKVNSIIIYRHQNDNEINKILFNLESLSTELCQKNPDNITNTYGDKSTDNVCEVFCQPTLGCYKKTP